MVHVMSEVKKYNAYGEGLTVHFELDSEGAWVAADDFDAQRLRADTAEAELARLEEEFDTGEHALITLKLKLDAVERRNASLVPLVSMAKELLSTISKHQTMAPKDWCESFRGEVSRRITDLDAALNQKYEGESHAK